MKLNNHILSDGTLVIHQQVSYQIQEELGSGGFGITYRATYSKEVEIQEKYGLIKTTATFPVAIKELFIEGKCIREGEGETVSLQSMSIADFDDLKRRFLDEAETLSKLNDVPHVVHVIDFFEANNTAYMVMEFVEGDTLATVVHNHGPVNEVKAISYLKQVSEGIEAVHEQGILHRDIKPANLIISEHDEAVIVDFGAAREFLADQSITQTVILTHGYAPIEQYSEKRKRGPYTDIYGLGATLYFALTGQRPPSIYDRDRDETLEVSGASAEMNKIIGKATKYFSEDRYQKISEFVDELDACSTDFEAPEIPESTVQSAPEESSSDSHRTEYFAEAQIEHADQTIIEKTNPTITSTVMGAKDEPALTKIEKGKGNLYFWKRSWANLIDLLVSCVLAAIGFFPLLFLTQSSFMVAGLIGLIIWVAYHAESERRFGQTLGKRMLKLHVASTNEDKLGIANAWKRALLKTAYRPDAWFILMIAFIEEEGSSGSLGIFLIFLLLFIFALTHLRKRLTLHDSVCNTVVTVAPNVSRAHNFHYGKGFIWLGINIGVFVVSGILFENLDLESEKFAHTIILLLIILNSVVLLRQKQRNFTGIINLLVILLMTGLLLMDAIVETDYRSDYNDYEIGNLDEWRLLVALYGTILTISMAAWLLIKGESLMKRWRFGGFQLFVLALGSFSIYYGYEYVWDESNASLNLGASSLKETGFAYDPNQDVYAISQYQKVNIYNGNTHKLIQEIPGTMGRDASLDFSPSGDKLAVFESPILEVYDLDGSTSSKKFSQEIDPFYYLKDNLYFFNDRQVIANTSVIDSNSGRESKSLSYGEKHVISSDNRVMLSVGVTDKSTRMAELSLTNLENGNIKTIDFQFNTSLSTKYKDDISSNMIPINFSPSEKLFGIATGSSVWIYETETGEMKANLVARNLGFKNTNLSINVNDRFVITVKDKNIVLWDLLDVEKSVAEFKGHQSRIIFLEWMDAKRFVSRDENGHVKFWRID